MPSPPPDKADIDGCRRCPLWENATQGVAGEGGARAKVMLVGEQPGDEEDRQGKPFVGPAGRLLRELLEQAGLAPREWYLTNAVKHFGWEPRGKRRIHKTPAQRDVAACHAWLEGEIAAMRPRVIVALGATALASLTGARKGIAASRGADLIHPSGAHLVATYHPSALLRAPDPKARAELRRAVEEDLARTVRLLRGE
jgi:uracil-DNA glycosylase family protein